MEVTEPRPFRWTREDYYRLCEAEWFQGRRVQLIDGEIIEMPAQKNWHAMAITLTEDALRAAFGPGHWVRVQMSLDLSPHSVPDPDLAVVPGVPRTYMTASNPTTALLIVEVSESTLPYDRGAKASLYATAGIADYWIVNLVQRQLEIHRDPVADGAQPYGFRYANRTILDPPDVVTPLAAPQARVTVADLLP
jgi:Uma2 family endonuclease